MQNVARWTTTSRHQVKEETMPCHRHTKRPGWKCLFRLKHKIKTASASKDTSCQTWWPGLSQWRQRDNWSCPLTSWALTHMHTPHTQQVNKDKVNKQKECNLSILKATYQSHRSSHSGRNWKPSGLWMGQDRSALNFCFFQWRGLPLPEQLCKKKKQRHPSQRRKQNKWSCGYFQLQFCFFLIG